MDTFHDGITAGLPKNIYRNYKPLCISSSIHTELLTHIFFFFHGVYYLALVVAPHNKPHNKHGVFHFVNYTRYSWFSIDSTDLLTS